MNTVTLKDPKTGLPVVFEKRFFSRLAQYRPIGEKFWSHSPHYPSERIVDDGSILESTSILQRFYGQPGLTPREQNYLIDAYCCDELTDQIWEELRNTMTLERIDRLKIDLKRLVKDRAQRLIEAENQATETKKAQAFVNALRMNRNRVKLPCGHQIMRHGGHMQSFDRIIDSHPDATELKCPMCLKPFPAKIVKRE